MSFASLLGAWSADPGTLAVLVAVLWLDGWRRVGPQDLLVVRSGLGRWVEREPWAKVGSFALVAWWPPIVVPMLIPATRSADPREKHPGWSADFFVAMARGRRRLRRVRLVSATLRALGVMLVLWIALAIPMATWRFGIHGLVRAIVQAFVMSVVMASGVALALRWLGTTRRASIRAALPFLFPFTAPRACEAVMATALRDLHPLAQVASLFGEDRFLLWIRPWAYDAVHDREARGSSSMVALVSALPRDVLTRALQTAPMEHTGRYCPRCARSYREEVTGCYDCGDLALAQRT